MSKVEAAAMALLKPGEQARQVVRGMSDGLNRAQRNATDAVVLVSDSAIVVCWLKGILPRPAAERFERSDLLDVEESDDPLPGIAGALERKNATHAVARAMGSSSTRPTLTIQTRKGDFSLFLKGKERGTLRTARLAIGQLIH
jgi:hypothetical protein